MKSLKSVFLLTVLLGWVLFPAVAAEATKETKEVKKKDTVAYRVSMDCHECEQKITEQLRFEKGVVDLKTDLKTLQVDVTFKPKSTDTATIARSIRSLGYEVNVLAPEATASQKSK